MSERILNPHFETTGDGREPSLKSEKYHNPVLEAEEEHNDQQTLQTEKIMMLVSPRIEIEKSVSTSGTVRASFPVAITRGSARSRVEQPPNLAVLPRIITQAPAGKFRTPRKSWVEVSNNRFVREEKV